jgi:bacillithiol synthase
MSMKPQVEALPLALSALADAVQSGGLHGMPPRPRTVAEWADRAVGVRMPALGAQWAATLAPAFAAHGHAAAALARVADGHGIVVTTGQQPGLFGGPAYTLIKALSARAFAERLEAVTGLPCIAVFWAATDDADFAEGASTHLPSAAGTLTPSLERLAEDDGRMLARVPVRGADAAVRALHIAAGGAAWPEPIRAAVQAYSASGATVGSAYLALMRALLSPLGIPVLDASHDAVRAATAPVLQRALDRAAAIDAALRTRTAVLTGLGYTPQVELVDDRSLVFDVRADGAKVRLPVSAPSHESSASRVLAPNVLLRPVIERALLPTMAYVGGPGELAYFAQVATVAEALGLPQPMGVPRASLRIVPPSVAGFLARQQATVDDVRDATALEGRLARAATSPAALDAIASLRAATRTAQHDLDAAQTPLPTPAIDATMRQLLWRVDRLERRVLASTKRVQDGLMRDVAAARSQLWPHGGPQERAINPLPWLARFGPPLMDDMIAAVRPAMHDLVQND